MIRTPIVAREYRERAAANIAANPPALPQSDDAIQRLTQSLATLMQADARSRGLHPSGPIPFTKATATPLGFRFDDAEAA